MENTMLSEKLKALLEIEDIRNYLKENQLLEELSRSQVALLYLEQNNLSPSPEAFAYHLLYAVSNKNVDTRGLINYEYSLLNSIKNCVNYLDVRMQEDELTKAEKKDVKEKRALAIRAAGRVLPDFINNTYAYLTAHGQSTKIYDENNYIVFDFDRMFEGVQRLAIHEATVNNLPDYTTETEKKYVEFIQENAEDFLNIVDVIESVHIGAVREVEEVVPTQKVNTNVRRFRSENRPVNKNGELLPSYLDYVTLDNKIVRFEEFKESPTYRAFAPFEDEQSYLAFVKSKEFCDYVTYLENPIDVKVEEVLEDAIRQERELAEKRVAYKEKFRAIADLNREIENLELSILEKEAEKLYATKGKTASIADLDKELEIFKNALIEVDQEKAEVVAKISELIGKEDDEELEALKKALIETARKKVELKEKAEKAEVIKDLIRGIKDEKSNGEVVPIADIDKELKALEKAKTETAQKKAEEIAKINELIGKDSNGDLKTLKKDLAKSIEDDTARLQEKVKLFHEVHEQLAGMMKLEARNGKYRLVDEHGSDFVGVEDMEYVVKGYFAKEKITLPAKEYRLAKKVDNETVIISQQQNERLMAIAKRIGAGALAFVILANATATPIKEVIDSIKAGIHSSENPGEPMGPEIPPVKDDPTYDNTEVKPEDEIRENPADNIEPPVDNVDENGDIQPDVPETEAPEISEEQPSEEETTESDPSYDQPDQEVPEENGDVHDKREEENPDDEFFFFG